MLQREADAAVMEAQVLEEAEAIRAEVENGKTNSEKVKMERTTEYVQAQIDFLNRSTLYHAESQESFVTSPPAKDISQAIKNKTKPGKADSMYRPAPNLPDRTRVETKPEVKRLNFPMNVHAQPYAPQHNPQPSMPTIVEPLAQYLERRDLVSSGLYQFDDKPET